MFQYNFNKWIIITEKEMPKSLQESINLWLINDLDFIVEELQECWIVFNSTKIKTEEKFNIIF